MKKMSVYGAGALAHWHIGYYIHSYCYWLHMTMEVLKEYFVLEDYVATSAIYHLLIELPESVKSFSLRGSYSDKELIELHARIVEKSPAFCREMMKLSHAKMLFDFGYMEECKETFDTINFESEYATDFFLNYDGNLSAEKKYLQKVLEGIKNS